MLRHPMFLLNKKMLRLSSSLKSFSGKIETQKMGKLVSRLNILNGISLMSVNSPFLDSSFGMRYFSTTTSTKSNQNIQTFGEYHQRTHYSGEVNNDSLLGRCVKLNGWVENIRVLNQNECVFLTMRDVSGVVQVIIKQKECRFR